MHASKSLKRQPGRALSGGSSRKIILCGFGLCLSTLGAASISMRGKISAQQAENTIATAPVGQVDPPSPSATAKPSEVPQGMALVSFQGQCDPSQGAPAEKTCKITLTRDYIDDLMNILEPAAPAAARRQLALNYSRLAARAAASDYWQLRQ